MNRILYVFLIALVMISCKNEESKDGTSNAGPEAMSEEEIAKLPVYNGEFIYTAGAAVLKGPDYIYAVQLDSMASLLADKVAPVKTDEFDMVPVVVQGVVGPNPALAEGKEVWKEMIAIKNIVSVSKTPSKADVKIEDKN